MTKEQSTIDDGRAPEGMGQPRGATAGVTPVTSGASLSSNLSVSEALQWLETGWAANDNRREAAKVAALVKAQADEITRLQAEIKEIRGAGLVVGLNELVRKQREEIERLRNALAQSVETVRSLMKPVETSGDSELLRVIARMLPYVQQYQAADFAELEALGSVCRAAEKALATIRPEEPAEKLCDCGEFCNQSLGQAYTGTCRRWKKGLPVNGTAGQ